MREISVSEFTKTLSADRIVEDAVEMSEELQKAFFRGIGDTREAARARCSRATGIPESYLVRLRYKRRDLTDISGAILIKLAAAYSEICLDPSRRDGPGEAVDHHTYDQEFRGLRH